MTAWWPSCLTRNFVRRNDGSRGNKIAHGPNLFPHSGINAPGAPNVQGVGRGSGGLSGRRMSDGQSAIRLADRHYASRMTTNGGERGRPALATFLWPVVSGLLIMAVLIRFVVFADGQPPGTSGLESPPSGTELPEPQREHSRKPAARREKRTRMCNGKGRRARQSHAGEHAGLDLADLRTSPL